MSPSPHGASGALWQKVLTCRDRERTGANGSRVSPCTASCSYLAGAGCVSRLDRTNQCYPTALIYIWNKQPNTGIIQCSQWPLARPYEIPDFSSRAGKASLIYFSMLLSPVAAQCKLPTGQTARVRWGLNNYCIVALTDAEWQVATM